MSDATGTVRGRVTRSLCVVDDGHGNGYVSLDVLCGGTTVAARETPVAIAPLTPEAHATRVEVAAGACYESTVPFSSWGNVRSGSVSDVQYRELATAVLVALGLAPEGT